MVSTLVEISSNLLHLAATAILVGYYLLLATIFLPVLEKAHDIGSLAGLLGAIHRRAQPVLLGSILAFLATGTVMLVTNDAYQGLGNFFANPWSILMTVKHLLIAVMISMGFSVNAVFRTPGDPEKTIRGFRTRIDGAAITGVCVLLLTAICEAL